MNEFEEKYNNLDNIYKKAINAYRSAREFMMSGINNSVCVMVNGRIYPTVISSIVNEIFACELFFKSMIMIKTGKLPDNQHKFVELYKRLDDKEIKKQLPSFDLDEELKKINTSFKVWRYCFQYDSLEINSGFIFALCKVLEESNRKLILKKFKLDMEKSFI